MYIVLSKTTCWLGFGNYVNALLFQYDVLYSLYISYQEQTPDLFYFAHANDRTHCGN